ncbi:S41 family peptidase [Cohnella nanjingensis]|uniref:PDZ domain-containing protein n=1 Tax=Cohnella nanjingensis TaxID=1387779 RepID=A0A7X0VF09_9BACL|nr:S41 family peptidase [Cohnella nanjingensis]MBB6671575.1 hypothetical protein [Cohnella nanjingensis]
MSMAGNVFGSWMWLTVYEMGLILLNLTVLVGLAVPVQKRYRWFDFLPSAGVAIAIASMLNGDTTLLAWLIYALTAILFFCTVKNVFRPARRIPTRKFKIARAILCACGVIPLGIALMVAGETRYNPVSHFGDMGYAQAFVHLNARLSEEYPFGDWKKVDWDRLKRKYEPIFEKAEQTKDKDLYYKTLREYLFSLRDGHIKIANERLYDGNTVFKHEAGGGLGISAIRLDDGKVLVDLVLKDSPAERSGIKLGAEIVSWNGEPAKDVYARASWSESPMATDGDRLFNQGRFMARAPIGQEVRIAYRNRDDHELKNVALKAYDDHYETLKRTRAKWSETDAPIEASVLSNGYGYVKIRYFLPSKTISNPEKVLKEALNLFRDRQVKGIVIDVRDNPGGDDDLVASMAGFFVDKKRLYEYVSYYSRITRRFEINAMETRIIKPAEPRYTGNVAILINHRTGSSGEGLPIALKGMPHVKIVGFTSTNGSFGVVTGPIRVEMPEGYLLQFPDGRSLNQDKVIQGDSDDTGQGGGIPDIRIPLNEQNFEEKYIQGQDVELNYAIDALARMK